MNFPFQERKREVDLFRDVFGGEQGQDLLAILAKKFHVYKFMQTPDPYVSAFQEGQRSVVVQIMETIQTDLDGLKRRLDLQQEAKDKQLRR
jgi:hypothetical protein